LVSNGDFNNGTTGWTNNGVTQSVTDGINTLTSSLTGGRGIFTAEILNLNDTHYFIAKLKPPYNANVQLGIGDYINENMTPNAYNLISQIKTGTTRYRINFFFSNVGDILQVDYAYAYNLTSLGIATLTKSQLDYLFTVWQFNTLNALVARQFIQEA
jgi:hypothetical protein